MKNSGHGSKCSDVIVSRLNGSVSLVSLLVQHVDLHVLIRTRLRFETCTCDVVCSCTHVVKTCQPTEGPSGPST